MHKCVPPMFQDHVSNLPSIPGHGSVVASAPAPAGAKDEGCTQPMQVDSDLSDLSDAPSASESNLPVDTEQWGPAGNGVVIADASASKSTAGGKRKHGGAGTGRAVAEGAGMSDVKGKGKATVVGAGQVRAADEGAGTSGIKGKGKGECSG
ncbi:hypothetical protein FRC06_001087, partial [Ceratobasidium sp. 370]